MWVGGRIEPRWYMCYAFCAFLPALPSLLTHAHRSHTLQCLYAPDHRQSYTAPPGGIASRLAGEIRQATSSHSSYPTLRLASHTLVAMAPTSGKLSVDPPDIEVSASGASVSASRRLVLGLPASLLGQRSADSQLASVGGHRPFLSCLHLAAVRSQMGRHSTI